MLLFYIILSVLPLLICSRYHRFQANHRNIQCECVPLHLCNDDDVIMNGHGLLEPRTGSRPCPQLNEICCEKPLKEKIDYDEGPVEDFKPGTHRCGVAVGVKTRIISGSSASFGELPWNLIVQEITSDKEQGLHKCGASLIHPKVAITAAHCVTPYFEEPEKIRVRAGEWDIQSHNEPLPYQDNFVEEILIHRDYNPLSLKNDIAMLILVENFRLTDNVNVICLPSPGTKVIENKCVASGWGKNAYKNGIYPSILKKVQLRIIPRGLCLDTLRSTRLGPRYNLHKSFICAGGKKDQDSCKGDGGSPLICPLLEESERFVQVGIVSWGIGCGLEGVPGVYVNVPLYLEWIDEEMSERELDVSSFRL